MRAAKRLFPVLCFLFSFGLNLQADEPQITIEAAVNKSEIALDEYCNYRAVISSSVSLLNPKIKLPDLEKDFIVLSSGRSQNVVFSGAQTRIQIILEYALQPRKEGKFKIRPLELAYRGKIYKSEDVSIGVVSTGNAAPAAPKEEIDEKSPDEKITL